MPVAVTVLGDVGVQADDGAQLAIPAGRPLWALAMLALAGGRPVSVDRLVAGLWGDDAAAGAAKTLQVHVSTLRSRLREYGIAVTLSDAGYRLDVAPDGIDVVRFERLADEGLRALGDRRPDVASELLSRAAALWSDGALANVLNAPFAAHEADRLQLRRAAVVQGRIEADLALGLGATLLDEARAAAEADPYDERACAHLMLALYRAGRHTDALAAFRSYRNVVVADLGVDPSPSLVDLERQVLTHDPALLARPDPVVSSGHNLPEDVSSFVGREAELTTLIATVSRARLITLTGAGGSGKTRLATKLARLLLERFSDGVRFVELAPVSDPELVTAAVVETVRARVDDGLPGLLEAIGTRAMLLVLDNCEHLIDSVASTVDQLLRRCSNLVVLATSREAMSLEGEFVFRVPPLGVDMAAGTGDACALFVDRAVAQRPGDEATLRRDPRIAEICVRLDGLPLAIELAAARLRTFTIGELARALSDRFQLLEASSRRQAARQRTLRNLISWSYELLPPEEQLMFERLSVFAGGFTSDAVVALAACAPAVDDPRGILAALVDKSLVELDGATTGRYRLLETIRQFAAECLCGRGAAVVRATHRAHAEHYLAVAEAAARCLELGPGQYESLLHLDLEHDNLRAAIANLADDDDVETALRIAVSLRLYCDTRGGFSDGLTAMTRLLDRVGDRATEHIVLGLLTASELSDAVGDVAASLRLARRARVLAAEIDRTDLEIEAASTISGALAKSGQLDEALEVLDELPPDNSSRESMIALMGLGYVHQMRGNFDVAVEALESALAIAESHGNQRRAGLILSNLASVHIGRGELALAATRLERAHELSARLRDQTALAYITVNLGLLALSKHDHSNAWMRYRESLLACGPDGDRGAIGVGCLGIAVCCTNQGNVADSTRLHGLSKRSPISSTRSTRWSRSCASRAAPPIRGDSVTPSSSAWPSGER